MSTAPVLFVSHGAPTFALEPGDLGSQLSSVRSSLNGVRVIVCISAHWQTDDIKVSTNQEPSTIHDFYGFAQELYELNYPAKGQADVAKDVLTCLHEYGLTASADAERGFDHGVWVPLMHLRPEADIPIVCVSLPFDATADLALQVGRALSSLRRDGVMIMGSGSMTHNLSHYRAGQSAEVYPYVNDFTQWVRDKIVSASVNDLLRYRELAPAAKLAHPTQEHFLPIFSALGASTSDDQLQILSTEVLYGMLSMESYLWQA